MGEDAYSSFKPGGSLKFKGGETVASKKKKKHKSKDGKSKSSSHPIATSLSSSSLSRRERDDEAGRHVYDHSGHADDVDDEELSCKDVEGSSAKCKTPSNMTDAEKRFAEVQRRRMADKIRKEASKSHKERVSDFNKYLENLSEHHDLPKVGPG